MEGWSCCVPVSVSDLASQEQLPPQVGHLFLDFIDFSAFAVGILISGGQNGAGDPVASVEIFIPDLNKSCSLPSLTTSRSDHSQNNFLACGGETTPTTCEVFTPGVGWSPEPYSLTEGRRHHTSWTLNNGSVLLLGGLETRTTEILTPGVGTGPAFSLKYSIR